MTHESDNNPPPLDYRPADEFTPSPDVPARSGRNIGQRLADASWIACGAAILMSFFIQIFKGSMSGSATTAFNIVYFTLIGAGVVCAIIALAGTRLWGKQDVVRPASIGLLLSLAMVGLTLKASVERKQEQRRQMASMSEERQKLEQYSREALLHPGWFGLALVDGLALTVTSLPLDNPLYRGIPEKLGTDVSLILVNAQNGSKTEATIDLGDAVLTYQDGRQLPFLDTVKLLENAKVDREQLMKAYAPPFRIPPERIASTLMFLPPGVDWLTVRGVTLKVNGTARPIGGQFLNEQQKRQLMQPASLPASQQTP